MNKNEIQKETAIQNEQQLKSKKDIVDNIINVLANNNLSIIEAKEILRTVSHKLGEQKVENISTGWIDANKCAPVLYYGWTTPYSKTDTATYPCCKYQKQGVTICW